MTVGRIQSNPDGRDAEVVARQSEQRRREEEAAWWSALLMSALEAARIPSATQATPPSEIWRPDASMTRRPSRDETRCMPPLAGTDIDAEHEGQDPGQVHLRLTGGLLGELALVVERRESGLRVRIGAAEPFAMNLLDAERESLLRALAGWHVPVESLTVTSLLSGTLVAAGGSPGADLASRRPRLEAARLVQRPAQAKPPARRLNLIG